MAIRACCLQDSVTPQLLHYYVKKQEQKELELGLSKEGMIIDVSTTSCDDDDEEDGTTTTNMSPLTEPSALSMSSESVVATDEQQDEPPAHEESIEEPRA